MAICRGCHDRFNYVDLENGFCPACAKTPLAKAARRLNNQRRDAEEDGPKPSSPPVKGKTTASSAEKVVLTTETALDLPIITRHGIVSAEAVVGINLLKDALVDLRDLVGGRSTTAQREMANIREALFADLRMQAARHRANMVIAVSLSFSDFGARGTSLLAVATGTAVTAGERSAPE